MATLSSFTFLSLDGYYKGLNEDIGWHQHGEEEGQFSAESLQAGNILLFGRKTFEMMNAFWPTEMAAQQFPDVARGMNEAKKIVASDTLQKTDWNNTEIISGNIVEQIRQLKQNSAKNITILGSGQLLTALAAEDLIDEYSIMIDPVAIGAGTALFNGLTTPLQLQLISTRSFKSGVVLHNYKR
ncbi:dihydrofolate reductase [Lacibacter luteus]|uniref:Dihydrofolate reductase n=1 Tax=Lacibacter luteus TaxID=2508719 RepID=A0A4Q1CG11_9BACT|nr:dihydrofolate reductase family protein [Lacibacter luteus]RXK58964.1 dihydrofolate reductase [Lacibacter luteus]